MRRPVRVLHASRSVHTAPDHVSSPSSYAFFLHLLLLLLLAPFILPFLSWIQDSSFVHNDHSSSFPFGFPLSSPLPLLFPLSPFFRIILSLLGFVIAVLSLFYIYISRESRISISDLKWKIHTLPSLFLSLFHPVYYSWTRVLVPSFPSKAR